MRKLKKYKPTRFMAKTSRYDQDAADFAVMFIEQLCHTKGTWAGKRFELIDWQEQIVRDIFGILKPNGYRQFNTAYVEIPKKQGKQLAIDTPIPTPEGWSTMGDLQIGDALFDENGCICHVVAKSAVDDTEQAYKLTFRDGSSIVAGEHHLWNCEQIIGKRKVCILQTGEIFRRTEKQRRNPDALEARRSVIRIKVAPPLRIDHDVPLPVDPYLYGYWLGNGSATKPEVAVSDVDLPAFLRNVPYRQHNLYPQICGGSFIVKYSELKTVLVPTFRDKRIQDAYLRASIAQRWALLQGLVDSDGSIGERKAQSTYVSTIKQLAESVRELLWSLGIKNAMTESPSMRFGKATGETLYTIRFTTFEDQITSRLQRKQERSRIRTKETRSSFHYLESITPVNDRVKMQCVQIDSTSHCYLAGRSMIPTHNSELAAAVALLLTCGDGEERAEVYGCAADRQQATIVFDVAADMVRMCPALTKRVKILTTAKRIIYEPTNSFYQVLSAEAYSKHGFYIHGVVFDELHTQPNRKLFDVMTKGSGDARMQPLYFLITTAGTDTKSICYETHEKAKDILDGRKIDATFYPVIYGADENDDWTNPKVWKKANPSLGITVGIDKVQAACESARQNPGEENSFRQLRLNQWVKQSIRWMPMEKWDACAFPVDPDELEGRVCYGGLDLSSTSDITAFVLVFPPEDEEADKYQILPFFWLPEETLDLRVKRDHVPYDLWVRQGLLNVTEGNVIHYGFIEKFIEQLGERYHIKEIAFDRWGAVQMVQNLEGMGFTVVPFGQGFKDMSPPTKELMRLVLQQRIAHGGNPVLRWNMDNIFIRTDPAGNIKADKEKSTEKIDGAIATIMALDRAIRNEGVESVYDGDRGLLFI
ncbi:MAG: terminase large subunit [Bacteroidota bacterium]|nr:terminase large subunit [Bacteroidota bacterium]